MNQEIYMRQQQQQQYMSETSQGNLVTNFPDDSMRPPAVDTRNISTRIPTELNDVFTGISELFQGNKSNKSIQPRHVKTSVVLFSIICTFTIATSIVFSRLVSNTSIADDGTRNVQYLMTDVHSNAIMRDQVKLQSLSAWSDGNTVSMESNSLSSRIECSVPEENHRYYQFRTCHCYDCCVYNADVYVFDDGPKKQDNVTVQIFASRKSIGVLHFSQEGSEIAKFDNALWVEDPVHYTINFYEHILAMWFWNADIWNTWRKESWTSLFSFHWMLAHNLKKRDHFVDTWYALSHPKTETPLGLYRGANRDNRETKVCYRHLMVGHHHVTQGLWEETTKGEKLLGQNTDPNFKVEPNSARVLSEYLDFYLSKSGLIDIHPVPRKAVYISRQDSSRRRILNREEILAIAAQEGFEVEEVSLAEMTTDEANRKLRSASLVFGSHGAGFANTIVMGKGTVVMELHPFGYQKWVYAHLARAMGQFYHYWYAPDDSYTVHTDSSMEFKDPSLKLHRNFYRHRDFRVDTDAFRSLVVQAKKELKSVDLWHVKEDTSVIHS